MKAKRKIGAGCGFAGIVNTCKKALKKSVKAGPETQNMGKLIKSTVCVARKHVKKTGGRSNNNNKNKLPRVIKVPKTGGSLSLIPILSGLSALGALTGGVANIVKTIRGIRSSNGSPIHLGKGMYLTPYKSGSSYTIVRKCNARASRKRDGKRSRKAGRKKMSATTRKTKISADKKKNNKKSRKIRTGRKSLKAKN